MNYVLHIDTSGDVCYTAIAKEGKLLARIQHATSREHAATLNLQIENVLLEASIKASDLSAIAIIAGPGSYTGLRIGMATAKGLCFGLNIPLMAYNKLDLLVLQEVQNNKYASYAALLPARSGEYFATVYDASLEYIIPPKHILANEWEGVIKDNMYIIGDGLSNREINEEHWLFLTNYDYDNQKFATLSSVEPFYLKDVFLTSKKG